MAGSTSEFIFAQSVPDRPSRTCVISASIRSQSLLRMSRGDIVRSSSFCGSTRSEEHTSELQSLMRISYAVFCLKKKKKNIQKINTYSILKAKHMEKSADNNNEDKSDRTSTY